MQYSRHELSIYATSVNKFDLTILRICDSQVDAAGPKKLARTTVSRAARLSESEGAITIGAGEGDGTRSTNADSPTQARSCQKQPDTANFYKLINSDPQRVCEASNYS